MTSPNHKPLRAIIWRAVSSQSQVDNISLEEQLKQGQAWCAANGCTVVDVLTVQGHSRSNPDIFKLFDDYAAINVWAYHQLRQHWQTADFDVLWAFEDSRLYRSAGGVALLIDCIVSCGAKIYFHNGGWIDESNREMSIGMSAFRASAGIKRLSHMYKAGMRKRMERGLSMNRVPDSHRLVYDENGKPLHMEVNSANRRMYEDAATLLLEGVGWLIFGNVMAARFGHYSPRSGKPYVGNYFWRLFHNPYSWGAAARNFVQRYGLWAFDPAVPLPEGVELERNPNPPVPPLWSGQLAEDIKAELRRRNQIVSGTARPHNTYKFTGLLLCDECGHAMAVFLSRNATIPDTIYWGCSNAKSARRKRYKPCTQRRLLRDDLATEQIRTFFALLAQRGLYDITQIHATSLVDHQARADQIQQEIDELNKQINTLIMQQASAPTAVQANYTALIQQAASRMEALRRAHLEAVAMASDEVSSARKAATESIQAQGNAFWNSPSLVINQTLHKALGKARFYVRQGEIIDAR